MRNIEQTGDLYGRAVTLKQIQKRTAKKLFEVGETIYLQSSNFMPINAWSNAIPINNMGDGSFELVVNYFEYYNCQNSETGLYANFYTE